MIDDSFSAIELPITWPQFWQLPQNPAYKYEYFDDRAWLSPRPKSYVRGWPQLFARWAEKLGLMGHGVPDDSRPSLLNRVIPVPDG